MTLTRSSTGARRSPLEGSAARGSRLLRWTASVQLLSCLAASAFAAGQAFSPARLRGAQTQPIPLPTAYDVGILQRVSLSDTCISFVRLFGTLSYGEYQIEEMGAFQEGDTVIVSGGALDTAAPADCRGVAQMLRGNAIQANAAVDFGCGVLGTDLDWCFWFDSFQHGEFEFWGWPWEEQGDTVKVVGKFIVPPGISQCPMGPLITGSTDPTVCRLNSVARLSWGRMKTLYR